MEVNILIEVNVAEEESKFGVSVKETPALVEEIAKLPGIHIQGLMTIAPYTDRSGRKSSGFPYIKKIGS